jgi:hypothetical protein
MAAAEAKCIPLKSKILFALKQFSVTSPQAKHRVGLRSIPQLVCDLVAAHDVMERVIAMETSSGAEVDEGSGTERGHEKGRIRNFLVQLHCHSVSVLHSV